MHLSNLGYAGLYRQPYDDHSEDLAHRENRFRVIGTDAQGNVVLDLPSKTEKAARASVMFLEKVHPELRFSVRPIDAGEKQVGGPDDGS